MLLGGLRDRIVEYILHGYGDSLNLPNLSIRTENFEAKAVPLYLDPVTPGKLCLAPKVLLGGLRDRTVEYATWVWGFTKFAKSFYSNREFRSLTVRLLLIFRNPRKAMFGPESASWGVTGSYSVYDMGDSLNLLNLSIQTREFRSLNCSAVLIFRNPRKAMFATESASRGVTGSYS